MKNRPHHIQDTSVGVGKDNNRPIVEYPALWHRARDVQSSIGWREVNLNLRRIWNTLQDRLHGLHNRIVRHRL